MSCELIGQKLFVDAYRHTFKGAYESREPHNDYVRFVEGMARLPLYVETYMRHLYDEEVKNRKKLEELARANEPQLF